MELVCINGPKKGEVISVPRGQRYTIAYWPDRPISHMDPPTANIAVKEFSYEVVPYAYDTREGRVEANCLIYKGD